MNRDTLVAIFLLACCGVLLMASFEIREPDYGQLSPATWPRAIIALLTGLSLIYLVQSVRQGKPPAPSEPAEVTGIGSFFSYWRNVLWCFGLFALYLITMPTLGMLIGGSLFVFMLLNALGGFQPRLLLTHAAIALVSVGGMWCLFTFGLGVILPSGEILPRY